MATRNSPTSDASDGADPGIGMDHLTVVPANFEREEASDDEQPSDG